jgi:hypothetical protein
MKSKNEEFCKSKFDEFIKTVSKSASIHWEDVAQKDEPPDYCLYLNGTRYAVEVTIMMEKLEVGNLKLPKIAVVASLQQLVDEVEATARRNRYLNGAYVVSFSRPLANFSRIRGQIFDDLLAYVKTTQNVSAAPEQVVFKQGVRKCTIQKFDDQKSYIGRAGPSGGKWEGEIAEEICTLLEERVNVKCHKLGKITDPKILLLYDAYHFASPEMYESCLSKLVHLQSFHTVFIVWSDGPGWVLHSENSNWPN